MELSRSRRDGDPAGICFGEPFPRKDFMSAERPRFFHRSKEDGTFDSICMKCFRTVDTAKRDADLADKEQTHVCHGEDLLNLGNSAFANKTAKDS
jgi:hypothetical protein